MLLIRRVFQRIIPPSEDPRYPGYGRGDCRLRLDVGGADCLIQGLVSPEPITGRTMTTFLQSFPHSSEESPALKSPEVTFIVSTLMILDS